MPRLTDADRARLRAANPDAFILRSSACPDDDFVFRPVGLAEFDAFLAAANGSDSTEKIYAHRTLACDCVLFPSDFAAWAKANPATAHVFGNELSLRAGMGAEVQSDAL
jgi:hypothetical protein